jgi:hypothetical protein
VDLSGRAARRLNEALALEGRARLHGGQALASMQTTTQPSAVELLPDSGIATYDFGEGDSAYSKLSSREVLVRSGPPIVLFHESWGLGKPTPLGYDFIFTRVGGWISPDGSTGELDLPGGLDLLLPYWPKPMFVLGTFVLNITGRSLDAELLRTPTPAPTPGRNPILTATEGVNVLSVDPTTRTFLIQVPALALTEAFAATLNETFMKSAPAESILVAGDRLGRMSLSLIAR